ncbi:MAG: prepilin-type N-terminal cleavage/methylation domain-containing protein [Candidatus Omnitrophica bacterium]|nr:prepilin-type N-terminal cleavage/methylation domain-containing protein [Candidatus Omnitrophota bacterium]
MIKISRCGFSLLEVLVAAVIFAIAAVGIFGTISAARTPTRDSNARLGAATDMKRVSDKIQSLITAGAWTAGDPLLSPGLHQITSCAAGCLFSATEPAPAAGSTYTITTDAAGGVNININIAYTSNF